MAGDLNVVWAKLARAKSHAEEFNACQTEFLKRDPYAINAYRDRQPPHTVHFAWQVKEQPPIELALIFGDLLSNLRATLDYLVWQLVLAANVTPTNQHAFPCVKVQEHWASAVGRRLVGIDPRWIHEIASLQPYNRPNEPERHLLAVLDSVNNANKHHTLPPIVVTLPEWPFEVGGLPQAPDATIQFDNFMNRPFEDGKDFLRITVRPPSPCLQVKLQRDPPLRIAFSDGLSHDDGWTYTQSDLIDWVERAVAVFKPAFAS